MASLLGDLGLHLLGLLHRGLQVVLAERGVLVQHGLGVENGRDIRFGDSSRDS